MFCLLSTFWQGLLSTFALFALSFAAVLFVRLAVYYIKNSIRCQTFWQKRPCHGVRRKVYIALTE